MSSENASERRLRAATEAAREIADKYIPRDGTPGDANPGETDAAKQIARKQIARPLKVLVR